MSNFLHLAFSSMLASLGVCLIFNFHEPVSILRWKFFLFLCSCFHRIYFVWFFLVSYKRLELERPSPHWFLQHYIDYSIYLKDGSFVEHRWTETRGRDRSRQAKIHGISEKYLGFFWYNFFSIFFVVFRWKNNDAQKVLY